MYLSNDFTQLSFVMKYMYICFYLYIIIDSTQCLSFPSLLYSHKYEDIDIRTDLRQGQLEINVSQ